MPLSTQVYKWVPANLVLGGVEILLVVCNLYLCAMKILKWFTIDFRIHWSAFTNVEKRISNVLLLKWFSMHDCAPNKITRSPKVPNYEIQGAQHKAYMKEKRLSGRPKAKVSRLRHLGALRVQLCNGLFVWLKCFVNISKCIEMENGFRWSFPVLLTNRLTFAHTSQHLWIFQTVTVWPQTQYLLRSTALVQDRVHPQEFSFFGLAVKEWKRVTWAQITTPT